MQEELKKRARKVKKKGPQVPAIKTLINSFAADLDEVDLEKFNILEYWYSKKNEQPELFALAKVVFSLPATQVSVERLFSNVSYILNPLRNALDSSILDDILVLRMFFNADDYNKNTSRKI